VPAEVLITVARGGDVAHHDLEVRGPTAASTPRTRSTADGWVKNGMIRPRVPVDPVTSERALARGR
jgi:hypothetical protein